MFGLTERQEEEEENVERSHGLRSLEVLIFDISFKYALTVLNIFKITSN